MRLGDRGVVLPAVLWMLALLGTAAAVGLVEIRIALAASANRAAWLRDTWSADACLTFFRARLDRELRGRGRTAWYDPARLIPDGCAITVTVPDRGPVDINALSLEQLQAFPGFDDRLAARVLDWRSFGDRVRDFSDLSRLANPSQRRALDEAYPALRDRIVYEPNAWVVSVLPHLTEVWVAGGRRVAVTGRVMR